MSSLPIPKSIGEVGSLKSRSLRILCKQLLEIDCSKMKVHEMRTILIDHLFIEDKKSKLNKFIGKTTRKRGKIDDCEKKLNECQDNLKQCNLTSKRRSKKITDTKEELKKCAKLRGRWDRMSSNTGIDTFDLVDIFSTINNNVFNKMMNGFSLSEALK